MTLTRQRVAQIKSLGKSSHSGRVRLVDFVLIVHSSLWCLQIVIQHLQSKCWLTDSCDIGKRKPWCWEKIRVSGVNFTNRCASSKSRSRFKCMRPAVTRVLLQWQLIERLALLQWLYSYVNIEMSQQKYFTDCSAIACVGKTYGNLLSTHMLKSSMFSPEVWSAWSADICHLTTPKCSKLLQRHTHAYVCVCACVCMRLFFFYFYFFYKFVLWLLLVS